MKVVKRAISRRRTAAILASFLRLTEANFPPNRTNPSGRPRVFEHQEEAALANQDRGTKREDPDTGKKFYDLNRDPIVSPYTGKSYPRSYFEQSATAKARAGREEEDEEEEAEVEEVTAPVADEPEVISLEDADAEEAGETGEEIPDVEDVEDVEDIGEDDADVFLEEDEEEDGDLDFDVGSGDER
jgi:uncharacterized protein (TIGR02300 family)